jgi:hypothetical protein
VEKEHGVETLATRVEDLREELATKSKFDETICDSKHQISPERGRRIKKDNGTIDNVGRQQ